jgi:hypothetical protein
MKLMGEAYWRNLRRPLNRRGLSPENQAANCSQPRTRSGPTSSIPSVVRVAGQRRGNAVEHVFQASLEFRFPAVLGQSCR